MVLAQITVALQFCKRLYLPFFWFTEAQETFTLHRVTAYKGLLQWICGAILIWDQTENPHK